LFFENTATINFAIDQYAEVTIDVGQQTGPLSRPAIEIKSIDRNESVSFNTYGELLESFEGGHRATALSPALQLHARVLRHFFAFWRRSAPITMTTRCAAPAGSGLGGSSALNIAMCVALRHMTLANYTDEELLGVARDLETTVIEVPAGIQDYWSALFGGVQAIRMDAGRNHRKVFYKQAAFLQSHVLLCYSGLSRNSGINNWAVYKGFIDKDKKITEAFQQIVKATALVEEGLERQNYEKLSLGIQKEWDARQKLAPSIATVEMLKSIEASLAAGATAAKVCGAGGGGCYMVLAPETKREAVKVALQSSGATLIPFQIVENPCVVVEE
jgi:D-glycero-alpha-D-manno-heptose-7-phosphate kinase